MPLSSDEFRQRLRDSRLLTAADLSSLDALPHATADELARQLVADEKLTPFQAETLLGEHPRPLVLDKEYVLLARLGAGGMGEVFQARHRRMDRLVALKMLPAKAVDSPEAVARFHREVKAASRLNHPNIVQVYDAREDQGVHFYVMEHVDGQDLSACLKREGSLPVVQVIEAIRQAAAGLAYAHEHSVIHRDIKRANLLLARSDRVHPVKAARTNPAKRATQPDESGYYKPTQPDESGYYQLKILDLGLARIDSLGEAAGGEPTDALTETGRVMGTADYMAPEQAQDTHAADERSDIYALGCTLFRLLTGKTPYTGDTAIKKILAHCQHPIPSLRTLRPDAPPDLDELCQRMMAKDPADRPQTMDEVAEALAACLVPAAVSSIAGSDDPTATFSSPAGSEASNPHTERSLASIDTTNTRLSSLAPPAESLVGVERRRIAADRRTQRWVIIGAALSLVALAGGIALIGWLSAPRVPMGTLIVSGPHDQVTIAAQREDRERYEELKLDQHGRALLPPGRYELGLLQGSGDYSIEPTQINLADGGEVQIRIVATTGVNDSGTGGTAKKAPPLAIARFNEATAKKHQQAWADYLGLPVEIKNSIGMELR